MLDTADYLSDEADPLQPLTDEDLLRLYGPNMTPAPIQQSIPAAYGDDEHESGPPLPAQAAAPPVDSGYANSLDWAKKLQGERPVEKPAKWWQQLAAAGAGGLAGWSNAAGRARPIDVNALQDDILHPGYKSKLQEWQSRLAPAEAIAKLEGEKQAAWWKGRAANTEEAYKQAETNRANQQGTMYQNRANQERNRYSVDSKTGAIFDRVTGETKTPAPTMAERKKMALDATGDEGMANYYAINGSLAGYGSTLATPKDPTAQENVDHWIAIANDPKSSQADKDSANAKIKQKERVAGETKVIVNASTPSNDMNADYLQAVANYEADPPSPRSSNYQRVIGEVKKLNKKWDVRTAGSAKRVLNDVTSGTTSRSIDAINTAADHLSILDGAITALGNNDIQLLNRLANAAGVQVGRDAVTTYNTIVHRVGPELTRAYNSTTTEGENKLNEDDFNPSRGPTQLRNNVGISAQLLNGKIKAVRNRFEKSVPGRTFDLVSPEAQSTFDRLGGHGSANGNSGMVTVQIPGHPPGQIPAANLAAFKAAHPDAKVQ